MNDTENAAAAATNPAPATDSSEVKQDAKTTTSTDAPADSDAKATTEDAGEEKWGLNGSKPNGKDERSSGRNDRDHHRRDRNGRDDRRGGQRGRGGGRGRGGHRGGFQHTRPHNNEFENLPESDDPVEIRKQVEFYYTDSNLKTDAHMFQVSGGPENTPVSIKHLANFKRMRHFKPYSAIVNALRESDSLVVVDDGAYSGTGNEAVKRKEPIVVPSEEGDAEKKPSIETLQWRFKNATTNANNRSIYAKNFGDLEAAGQLLLEQFFAPYGSVMVRRRLDKETAEWKGSVFVEFDSTDSQKQFLALDPMPKFQDNELTVMSKQDYMVMKCNEKGIEPKFDEHGNFIQDTTYNNKHANRGGRDSRGGRGRGRGNGRGRGGYDRRDDRRGDNRSRRDRSPRRQRDRSDSRDSVDSRDWNKRRDRFNSGKDDRKNRKDEERKEVEKDGHGVPVVKDTRTDAEIAAASKKRKADGEERAESPKKGKLEIKQDE